MSYFPFFIDIENKSCIIIGGGRVALRKVQKLKPFNPEITVIAPEICNEIKKLGGITLIERSFEENDLRHAFMVISATDDIKLNADIYDLCRERKILVNTVDDKTKCGFIFPSIVKEENVSIAVSTSGSCPVFARYLRKKLQSLLQKDFMAAKKLSLWRGLVKERIPSESGRKRALKKILDLLLSDITVDERTI